MRVSELPTVTVSEEPKNGVLTVNGILCAVYRVKGVLVAHGCVKGMPGATANLKMPRSHMVMYRIEVTK
jgi:hypothetical protein